MASSSKKNGNKHSGATHTTYFPKEGKNKGVEQYITNGWKLSNGQLIKVSCVTTHKSKLGKKGWIGNIFCEVVNTSNGSVTYHYGTMQKSTGKVVIDKLNWVLNPKAPNGGYCGTYIRSEN